jgi:hypothetical protein
VNTIGKRTSTVVRTILLAGVVTLAALPGYGQSPAAHGQMNLQPAPAWGWLYDPALTPYWYSPCYPFASCTAYQQFQILERRRERLQELRREQQPRASIGIQTPGGFATTPTDEAEIRPGYIESGQIRDEYQGSGDILPELLERRVRPSR